MQRRRIRQINPNASDSDRPMIEQRAREAKAAPQREPKARWPFSAAPVPDQPKADGQPDYPSAREEK